MNSFADYVQIYFWVSLIVFVLIIVWMVLIVVRLGQVRDYLSSIDQRIAGGALGYVPPSRQSAEAQSEQVEATFNYQGMKIEQTTSGTYILHSPQGFEHFSSKEKLQTYLQANYPRSATPQT